jgi:hypothetical protein
MSTCFLPARGVDGRDVRDNELGFGKHGTVSPECDVDVDEMNDDAVDTHDGDVTRDGVGVVLDVGREEE